LEINFDIDDCILSFHQTCSKINFVSNIKIPVLHFNPYDLEFVSSELLSPENFLFDF